MANDFKDIVQQNLSKIRESHESAGDFIKSALLTGWTDEDIERGLFLNGFKKEDVETYLKEGYKKLEEITAN